MEVDESMNGMMDSEKRQGSKCWRVRAKNVREEK